MVRKKTESYKCLRNSVVSMLRQSKARFFMKLDPNEGKSFWKAIKYLSKKPSSIPTLAKDGCTIYNDESKAQLLNECFANNFIIPESPMDSKLLEVEIAQWTYSV